jgi:hypothetical protein
MLVHKQANGSNQLYSCRLFLPRGLAARQKQTVNPFSAWPKHA